MKTKKLLIPIIIIGTISALWFTGIIPMQLAKISGQTYVNKYFPEMKLELTHVEYADALGDYLVTFKGANENTYSCVIGPKYLPLYMGQGLFAVENDYKEYYKDN